MRFTSIYILLFWFVGGVLAQNNPSVLEQSIKEGKSKNIKALIHITGGQLDIIKGNTNLANVKLSYDKNIWNPTVSYAENDNLGKLIIKAFTEGDEKIIDDDNKCLISLNDSYNYSLGVVLGAGKADMDFSNMKIAKALFRLGVGSFNINLANTSLPLLKIEAGIGEAKVDLSGEYKNDLRAQIIAGIGELTLYVPANVGVKCIVNGFLGDVHAPNYSKNGDEYTNDLFEKSKNNIFIKVSGAIGTIRILEK